MSGSQSTPNVGSLFQTAHQEGDLSAKSLQILTVPDLGMQIQAALGMPTIQVQASELFLVSIQPDDSGSIDAAGNTQAVIDGHNGVIDDLLGAKQGGTEILLQTQYLNGFVLNTFKPLTQVIRMDSSNYRPNLGTPLYDNAVALLGSVLAKTQEYLDQGLNVRSATLLITDGDDLHSQRNTARDVASLVHDMRMQERHIVAAMGISDGYTDFRNVFQTMGIEDQWILTPGNTPTEIRRAFQLFSSSAVRASQTAASFSQTAMGGFGS